MEAEEEGNQKMNLKLLVDTKSNRVLFAEVGKDFVDFLFQMLLLPMAAITKLLIATFKQEDMVGCFGNLCKSIELLSPDYMLPIITKDFLLKPTVGFSPNFLPLNHESSANNKKFYACSTSSSAFAFAPVFDSTPIFSFPASSSAGPFGSSSLGVSKGQYCNSVSDVPGTVCPNCNQVMSREMIFIKPKMVNSVNIATPRSSGGYGAGGGTYMVMDNLEVTPMSNISAVTAINKFQVRDLSTLVEKHVQVGSDEAVRILKALLETRAVLTAVFLGG